MLEPTKIPVFYARVAMLLACALAQSPHFSVFSLLLAIESDEIKKYLNYSK